MKLLIVDDEPIIRRGIKSLVDFEALGIETVLEAADGEQAFEIFQEALPDIVLADINMPGMSGLEFAEKVKTLNPITAVAMITGYDYFDYAQQAIKIGVEDYILKPVSRDDVQQLLHKLVKVVQQKASENQAANLVHQYHEEQGLGDQEGYEGQIQQLVERHFDNPDFTLSMLAEELGLSVGYTSGLFKKLFQVSFKEYVLLKRLDKARILLLTSVLKNYEISEAIGFNDPNYFSSVFKKRFGESPNQYRDRAKKGV